MTQYQALMVLIATTTDECLVGAYRIDKAGYGQIWTGGKLGSPKLAHRLVMENILGRGLTSKEVICHRCDNPSCVNPKHLFLGTHQDNTNDMLEKGRHRVIHGAAHYNAKLNEDKVKEMKHLRSLGWVQSDIAKYFGVSQKQVSYVLSGKAWGHVK